MFAIIPDGDGMGIHWDTIVFYDDATVASHRLIFLALQRIKRLIRDGVHLDDLMNPRYSTHHMEEFSVDASHLFVNTNSYRIEGLPTMLKQWHSQNATLTFLQMIDYAQLHIDALMPCVKVVQ